MRVPAVSFAKRIAVAVAVGLLACGLALPQTLAFAEGEDAPSAPLASSLMDGSASVVREDVALAAPEDDAAPEPVIGSFTVDGVTFAVTDGFNVQLVGASPDWQQATGLRAGEGSPQPSMPASEAEGSDADSSALLLPETVAYNDVEYAVTSIGAYAFYLSGVTSVEMPASIVEVDDRAFRSSDVASVEVAEGNPNYSSFDGALYDAEQSSLLLIPEGKQGTVLLPKTAESAAPSAFSHCPLVTQISVEEGSAAFASEDGLLYDASLETLLRVPAGATEITIREGCTTIAAGAMEACASLATINAPASVTSISPYLFEQQPETVMAPVAVAAVENDAEGVVQDGESAEAAPQLSTMVALSSADVGFPIVDPAAVVVSLSAGADAAFWHVVGFEKCKDADWDSFIMQDEESEGPVAPSVSAGSAATYNATYYLRYKLLPAGCGSFKYFEGQEFTWGEFPTNQDSQIYTLPEVNVESGHRFDGFWVQEAGETSGRMRQPGEKVRLPTNANLTITGYFDTVRIIWDPNGGSVSPTESWPSKGTTVTAPCPSRNDHYFKGWYTARVGGDCKGGEGNEGGSFDAPASNTTYYAHWERLYTVTFSCAHGDPSEASKQIRSSSRAVVLPTIPTVESGYKFNGWICPDEWEGLKDAGSSVPFSATASRTVVGDFAPIDYTITLNTDEGTLDGWAGNKGQYEKTYNIESDSIKLPQPQRPGYYFAGWSESDLSQPTLNVTVPAGSIGNREYQANWKKLYEITFSIDSTKGTIDEADAVYIREGQLDIVLPKVNRKDDWAFNGWVCPDAWSGLKADNTSVSFPEAKSYTVTASFSKRTWKVTWDANGGEVDPASQDVGRGDRTTAPLPKKNGFYFKGWYTAPTGGTHVCGEGDAGGTTPPITSDITYYAQWAREYMVAYKVREEGTGKVERESDTIHEGATTVVLPKATPAEGCGLNGFTCEGGKDVGGWAGMTWGGPVTFTQLHDYTVWVSFYRIPRTVRWEAQGGEVETATSTVGHGLTIAAPLPKKNGFYFKGWYTAPTGGMHVCGEGDAGGTTPPITSDITYYAQWAREYTVAYKVREEGTGKVERESDTIHEGATTVVLPKATPAEGCGLNGFTCEGGKDVGGWAGMTWGGPVTFTQLHDYTVWVSFHRKGHLVTWDANGGTVDPLTTEALHGLPVESPFPYLDGYICSGWYSATDDDAEFVCKPGEATSPITTDVAFYAQWAPALSVDVPIAVTAEVDLLGIEDQVPASGYIESRCGAPLVVEEVSFTALAGAADLFGEANTARVSLQALALEGDASWDASTPIFSFPLDADATESDASKLAALRMEGYEDHIPIGYRFAIPEDVLASIDPARFEQATTPVCSVVYKVGLVAAEG